MRKIFTVAMLAASSIVMAVPASADGPVSLPPLAPGETLLEVNAVGIVSSPATSASIVVTLRGEGVSEAEARDTLAAQLARATAAARAAGATAADIRVTPGESGSVPVMDMDMNATMDTEMNMAGISTESYFAESRVEIRLSDATRAQGLQRNLESIGAATVAAPVYDLENDSAARRAARAAAIANARADAESYALALNMRIGRILRVTERTGLDFMGMALSESNTAMRTIRRMEGAGRSAQVDTYVVVGVDFAMAPR
jgi:uncharacterized protein YggE